MSRSYWTTLTLLIAIGTCSLSGCACSPCGTACDPCDTCQVCDGCDMGCETCGCDSGTFYYFPRLSFLHYRNWAGNEARFWSRFRSNAIPEALPLGVVPRAHYQAMETNAEAVDFILYRHDFVLQTAELTPDGKDKILEIGARMRSAPFPVLVERSENNSNPELDSYRRSLVSQILTDLGNPDADQRTIVSTPYGPGYNSIEAERDYFIHVGGGNNNNFNNNNGGIGGFGGGIGGF